MEKSPEIIAAASKLIGSLTADNQANSVEKVTEKILDVLGGLTKDGIIDKKTFLSAIHGLSIDKDFTIRGKKKSIEIQLGTLDDLIEGES